ncbi:hypothetical protein L915_05176, partial [Phytophthora nicotianae]
MQEGFSLKQAKLRANVPRMARPIMRAVGPAPMDLSNASAVGRLGVRYGVTDVTTPDTLR